MSFIRHGQPVITRLNPHAANSRFIKTKTNAAGGGGPSVTGFQLGITTLAADDTFLLPLVSGGTYDFNVDWGDGSNDDINTWDDLAKTHTYAGAAADYLIVITGRMDRLNFANGGDALSVTSIDGIPDVGGWNDLDFYGCANLATVGSSFSLGVLLSALDLFRDCTSLTTVPDIDYSIATSMERAFFDCTGITTAPIMDFSSCTTLKNTFSGCASLVSVAGITTTTALLSVLNTFSGCNELTGLPLFLTSSVTNFSGLAYRCYKVPSVPLYDTSSGTNFRGSFQECILITSLPDMDYDASTDMSLFASGCSALTTFPAGSLDSTSNIDYTNGFVNCALDEASVDGILASLVVAGQSNGTLGLSGGTNAPPGVQGALDVTTLQGLGWTVTTN